MWTLLDEQKPSSRRRTVVEPVAYLYASIAGPVVLHRLKQIGVAKPLFSEKVVDDDLESANKWPSAHSMTPLYTKQKWQGLTDEEIHDCFQNRGRGSDGLKTRKMIAAAIEAMLKEKNT